jgi:hypothetical protein
MLDVFNDGCVSEWTHEAARNTGEEALTRSMVANRIFPILRQIQRNRAANHPRDAHRLTRNWAMIIKSRAEGLSLFQTGRRVAVQAERARQLLCQIQRYLRRPPWTQALFSLTPPEFCVTLDEIREASGVTEKDFIQKPKDWREHEQFKAENPHKSREIFCGLATQRRESNSVPSIPVGEQSLSRRRSEGLDKLPFLLLRKGVAIIPKRAETAPQEAKEEKPRCKHLYPLKDVAFICRARKSLVQYYANIGLVVPAHNPGGKGVRRKWSQENIDRIKDILHYRQAWGLPLEKIEEILDS